MDIVVRRYNDGDYDAVDKLLFDSFGYHREKVSDARVYEFVACLDDVIVGYYNLLEEIDVIRNIKIFHVGYVCVDTEYRGHGIGHIMMEEAIKFAKENNVVRLDLTSGNKREAAHRLYLSLGFEKRDTSVFRKELV